MNESNNEKKIDGYKLYAIFGVVVLILVVIGATYAFYIARKTAIFKGNAAGSDIRLNVEMISISTDKNLMPINDTVSNLTQKALGWNEDNNTYNSSWDEDTACIGKSGFSSCQIYEVSVTNNTNVPMTFNIGITSLVGENAPNIDVVKMDSKTSVTSNTSIKGNATGIASNLTLQKGQTSDSYYVLIFVRNDPNGQTDKGTFTGVVTATAGAETVKAEF